MGAILRPDLGKIVWAIAAVILVPKIIRKVRP